MAETVRSVGIMNFGLGQQQRVSLLISLYWNKRQFATNAK